MKQTFSILMCVLILAISSNHATAQGCVAVRQMGGIIPIGCTSAAASSSNSYNLPKGDIQVGLNYRYFHSWRHFVGSEEQKQREALGNAVNIFSHAVDLNLSYGLTNRLQLNVSIPYVHNERSQTTVLNKDTATGKLTRYPLHAKGIGDVRIGLNYW